MAVINLIIGASGLDARNLTPNSTYSATATASQVGKFSGTQVYYNGWRWLAVNIPRGATITSAVLTFYATGSNSGTTAKAIFYGDAADNSAAFGNSTAGKPEGRAHTSASLAKDFTLSNWGSAGYNTGDTLNVANIVQEIVNRAGWNYGNALTIVATDNGSDSGSYVGLGTYDAASTKAAKLDITYTVPLAETLTDNFNDNTNDTAKWVVVPGNFSLAEVNGQLELSTINTAVNNEGWWESRYAYSILGSYVKCRLKDGGNQALTTLAWYPLELYFPKDAQYAYWYVTNGTIYARWGGVDRASASFNTTTFAWIQIRETGGTMYWEYSATGLAGSWTTFYSVADPAYTLTNTIIMLNDTYEASQAATTVKLDSFNITPVVTNSERGLYTEGATGGTSANSERNIYLTGKNTNNSARNFYTTGRNSDNSIRNIYVIGKTTNYSTRLLYLLGWYSSDSSRNLYLIGKKTDNSTRGLYVIGRNDSESERGMYSIGGNINTSERSLYVIGKSNNSSENEIYVVGKDTEDNERGIYAGAYNKSNSDKSLSITGNTQSSSERGIYLSSDGVDGSERGIFITGLAESSDRGLHVIGRLTGDQERDLWLKGLQTTLTERELFLQGLVADNSHRSLYLLGRTGDTDERALLAVGKLSANDTRNISTLGKLLDYSQRDIDLLGVATDISEVGFDTIGADLPISERGVYVVGEAIFDERDLFIIGDTLGVSEKSLVLVGKEVGTLERELFLEGIASQGSERNLYVQGISPVASDRDIFIEGALLGVTERGIYLLGQAVIYVKDFSVGKEQEVNIVIEVESARSQITLSQPSFETEIERPSITMEVSRPSIE